MGHITYRTKNHAHLKVPTACFFPTEKMGTIHTRSLQSGQLQDPLKVTRSRQVYMR